jgi:hypothetical protein
MINEELNTNYVLAYLCETPDGTILQCKNRHDYQEYNDKVTGETYMIDGLGYYTRSNVNVVPAEYTFVTLDTPHELARQYVMWGTRGKTGDQTLKYISVANMETAHIQAIIDAQFQIAAELREFLKRELNFRSNMF